MKSNGLSEKQTKILEFLKSEIKQKGYQPAIRDICAAVGLKSTATVHAHLSALEEKGFIRRIPSKNRCIEILESTNNIDSEVEYVNVPIIGKVTAGEPILAATDLDGYFPVPVDMLGNYDGFMLKVRGDSMINAGIYNKDLILVRKQSGADNGDIVVALLEDSATVKRFYKEKDHIRLKAENEAYEDIISKEVEVLGKVVGLFRRF